MGGLNPLDKSFQKLSQKYKCLNVFWTSPVSQGGLKGKVNSILAHNRGRNLLFSQLARRASDIKRLLARKKKAQ